MSRRCLHCGVTLTPDHRCPSIKREFSYADDSTYNPLLTAEVIEAELSSSDTSSSSDFSGGGGDSGGGGASGEW